MGARIFVVGGGLALVAAAFIVQACGNTEEPATPVADGGTPDVVDSAPPKDTSPPAEEDAAACDLSADFTTDIPDAAIADGASTSGLCVQCANSKCSAQIDDCNKDCPCQGIAASALECYVKNPGNPTVCAAPFLGVEDTTRDIGIALITCLNGQCKNECATAQFQDAGTDAN